MQQTLDQLHDLKLTGFIDAWQELPICMASAE